MDAWPEKEVLFAVILQSQAWAVEHFVGAFNGRWKLLTTISF